MIFSTAIAFAALGVSEFVTSYKGSYHKGVNMEVDAFSNLSPP